MEEVSSLNSFKLMKFIEGYKLICEACEENGWGDPFSYSRGKEIYLALVLGHQVSLTYSGADAFDQDGPCEYKTTIGQKISGTYNGISVQSSWNEQVRYLTEDKIGKYKNHYFARFQQNRIEEVWKLNSTNVLSLGIEKLKPQYNSGNHKKDPRLGFRLSQKEIQTFGIKVQ